MRVKNEIRVNFISRFVMNVKRAVCASARGKFCGNIYTYKSGSKENIDFAVVRNTVNEDDWRQN